jgi:4-carboxymuconolactone decarboxylase
MTQPSTDQPTLNGLDDSTRRLVRLSAVITAGSETELRRALVGESAGIPAEWVEELVLQSYLFAGFPRALNAMREWRRICSEPPSVESVSDFPRQIDSWETSGEVTCHAVYGPMYERLRENIRALHPLLDDWMITDGYGKVLSRPGLDLGRRELCIMAACAAAGQDRQLHSHLHGARNVGVAPAVIDDAIEAIAELIGADRAATLRLLWARVRGK